jgi:rhamnosyltransferase
MDNVAVVIRTRDEAESLPATIDMVMAQSRTAEEIIVVDSGSTDGTVEMVRSIDRIRLIEIEPSSFSYGGSLNKGFSSTSCEFVVCLSAHARPVHGRWLEELIRPTADPRVVGVYGRQVAQPDAYPFVRRDLEAYYSEHPRVQTVASDHVFSNANSLVRRDAWMDVQFDEGLTYCEDQLWARTMILAGASIAYAPQASVFHSHNEGLREVSARCRREELAWRMLGEAGVRNIRSSLNEVRRTVSADYHFLRESKYGLRWFAHSLLYRAAQSLGRWRAHRHPLPGGTACVCW